MRFVKTFFKFSGATFPPLFGAIKYLNYLGLNWSPNTLKFLILLLLSALVGATAVVLSVIDAFPFTRVSQEKTSFEDSLLETLKTAFTHKKYADVCRIGEALSRPLFESGSFRTRLNIGKIVENAAASSRRKDKQIAALIDTIGWSLVELGDYPKAIRKIKHGIYLSTEEKNYFYEAKGYRHLGVIARRTKKFKEAYKYYQISREKTFLIPNLEKQTVMLAGLNHVLATLYCAMGDLIKATEYIKKSIVSFTDLNDEYRLNMCLVTKGDIELKDGKTDKAMDTYRNVLRDADQNTEKLQVARSYLGLAEIHLAENQWEDARKYIKSLEKIDLKDFKSESDQLTQIRTKLSRAQI